MAIVLIGEEKTGHVVVLSSAMTFPMFKLQLVNVVQNVKTQKNVLISSGRNTIKVPVG